jgi:hypothetical protein
MNKYIRLLSRIIFGLAILTGALYVADWATLRVRLAHGTAFGSVEIHQFLATSLKGSKTEYDLTGSFQQECTHSIFPQRGDSPCWWLQRHSSQWQ